MSLEGNLKSLNLIAVLQLVSNERMSGILRIKSKAEVVCIGFGEGMISGAFYERGGRQERFENYLVKSGMVSKENYAAITKIQEATRQPIINILLENNYLKREELELVIRFKIQEVLDEVFAWQDGEFKFEETKIMYAKSLIKIRLNTEAVILEGMRRIDEWPRIVKVISSDELVFRPKEKPDITIDFTDEEKRVVGLIDSKRTVRDIIEDGGLGRFRTYSAVYHLFSSGQLETYYIKPSLKETGGIKFSFRFLLVPIEVLVIVAFVVLIAALGMVLRQQKVIDYQPTNLDRFNYHAADQSEVFYLVNDRLPTADELRHNFE